LAHERLASQLELARYTTELKPKLSSFKNSNESSRATNERVRASLRASSFSSSPTNSAGVVAAVRGVAQQGRGWPNRADSDRDGAPPT
jgi:hypothetical protein